MTRRKTKQAPVVITVRDESIDHIYNVTSNEGQTEVAALIKRLVQRRAELDQQLITMADVLRELEVPEEDECECSDLLGDYLNDLTETRRRYRCNPFTRGTFRTFQERLPNSYGGSFLEREVIGRHMMTDLCAPDLGHLAAMVDRLAQSFSKPEYDFDHTEADHALRAVADEIREHAKVYEIGEEADEHDRVPSTEICQSQAA